MPVVLRPGEVLRRSEFQQSVPANNPAAPYQQVQNIDLARATSEQSVAVQASGLRVRLRRRRDSGVLPGGRPRSLPRPRRAVHPYSFKRRKSDDKAFNAMLERAEKVAKARGR